ncbi:MAG TPA: hypothetical protein VH186_15615 [Chloroflexia bacterium]|nr:hypothetical protein [Chloroflexia bacterium]
MTSQSQAQANLKKPPVEAVRPWYQVASFLQHRLDFEHVEEILLRWYVRSGGEWLEPPFMKELQTAIQHLLDQAVVQGQDQLSQQPTLQDTPRRLRTVDIWDRPGEYYSPSAAARLENSGRPSLDLNENQAGQAPSSNYLIVGPKTAQKAMSLEVSQRQVSFGRIYGWSMLCNRRTLLQENYNRLNTKGNGRGVYQRGNPQDTGTGYNHRSGPFYKAACRIIEEWATPLKDELRESCKAVLSVVLAFLHDPYNFSLGHAKEDSWWVMTLGQSRFREELNFPQGLAADCLRELVDTGILYLAIYEGWLSRKQTAQPTLFQEEEAERGQLDLNKKQPQKAPALAEKERQEFDRALKLSARQYQDHLNSCEKRTALEGGEWVRYWHKAVLMPNSRWYGLTAVARQVLGAELEGCKFNPFPDLLSSLGLDREGNLVSQGSLSTQDSFSQGINPDLHQAVSGQNGDKAMTKEPGQGLVRAMEQAESLTKPGGKLENVLSHTLVIPQALTQVQQEIKSGPSQVGVIERNPDSAPTINHDKNHDDDDNNKNKKLNANAPDKMLVSNAQGAPAIENRVKSGYSQPANEDWPDLEIFSQPEFIQILADLEANYPDRYAAFRRLCWVGEEFPNYSTARAIGLHPVEAFKLVMHYEPERIHSNIQTLISRMIKGRYPDEPMGYLHHMITTNIIPTAPANAGELLKQADSFTAYYNSTAYPYQDTSVNTGSNKTPTRKGRTTHYANKAGNSNSGNKSFTSGGSKIGNGIDLAKYKPGGKYGFLVTDASQNSGDYQEPDNLDSELVEISAAERQN